MEETIYISPDDIEVIDAEDYSYEVVEHFSDMPEVAKPLLKGAKKSVQKNRGNVIYCPPAFINMVKASIPEQAFQAILTDEQKTQIAN